MPLFLSLHQAPGLSQEEIAGYAPAVAEQVHATFRQLYVNTDSGFIATLYEAQDEKAVQEEFERIGFPYDAVHKLDVVMDGAALQALSGE
ncbi:nickel-binding protein [Streptomyces sp. NPDC091287]|uniref:nickel-binding protein n=1 Tax=Streptomyces sp. NPDC091287 TaxID=3365988 RepID=UPI0037FB75D5